VVASGLATVVVVVSEVASLSLQEGIRSRAAAKAITGVRKFVRNIDAEPTLIGLRLGTIT
jgi:hypothetical protein